MMSNNVNRTFLTLIWIPWRIPHSRVARGGTWVNVPRHGGKIAKNMHRNDEFSRNFWLFPDVAEHTQVRTAWLPTVRKHYCQCQLRIFRINHYERPRIWRLYFSLYSVFPKVKFSNACLVPIATFLKQGLPHLQARISNLQARPCL